MLCLRPCSGLAVKEKKWGGGGKGYTATPLSYEATPKQDAVPINVSERKPDSENRDEECVGVGDTSWGGGDGVAMVSVTSVNNWFGINWYFVDVKSVHYEDSKLMVGMAARRVSIDCGST